MSSITQAPAAAGARPARREVDVDAVALEAELRRELRGEVRFDSGSRALYTTDSAIFRRVPIGVVLPIDADDVAAALAVCRRHGAPILPRGGGTSISGNSCNAAVVLDLSKHMNRILELDPEHQVARVQPGVICDSLRQAAEEYHLTFAPDPSTHNRCNLGGMIGNNSCGIHSMMGGRTVDNIHELKVITYDGLRMRVGPTSDEELNTIVAAAGRRGEIYARLRMLRNRYAELVRERYPQIPRQCSGYNLDQLLPEKGFHVARSLVGSEGTCVVAVEAVCRLMHSPPERVLVVAGFPDIATAGDNVPLIREHEPIGLEGIDDYLVDALKAKAHRLKELPLLPEGRSWLYIELGADTREDVLVQAERLIERLRRQPGVVSAELFADQQQAHRLWSIRHEGLSLSRVPGAGDLWPGWEDGAVHPDKIGDYLRELRQLIDSFGYVGPLFAHLGQGCIHTRTNFDLTSAAGIAKYREFMEAAADLVVRYGGSLSGEHGDGRFRSELLPRMFGDELVEAFREFKAIWDPDGKMNPGIKTDPDRLDEHLRLGADYQPPQLKTHFQFVDDQRSFAAATVRCIGLGECRREHIGVMCPSYQATREEMHSTRGRARLLFEMLHGDPVKGGWQDEHVREALDLCLACKGCKSDCPANVDMATYKAEFLSHYYEGRLRPRAAYAMGLIGWWARLGSRMPNLVNAMLQAPGIGYLMKRLAGVAPQREAPRFAQETFKQWFFKRAVRNPAAPPVILWPDTFTNHFHPEIAKAAVEVLEHAGRRVIVPEQALCCGRPLYDFGMLTLAKSLLRKILDSLRDEIRAGTPLVGLEPSCAAVFRDELVNLLPDDFDAQRLSKQTFTLGGFLAQLPDYQPPRLARKAVVHGHCHHKSILKLDGEAAILERMGLDVKMLDSGCCGMAGSFGFEESHYDISMQIGEQRLLPAVRKAKTDTLLIADGFSCRHQICEGSNRQALHLAQVLQMGLHEGPRGPVGGYPEVRYPTARNNEHDRRRAAWKGAAALAGCALLAAGATYLLSRRRSG